VLRPYTFLGPEALCLRPDGSTPHPHLRVQPGIACKHCSLKTTSNGVLSRHLSKNHGVKRKFSTWLHEHVVSDLSLQSWGWHSAAGYWIVKPDRLIAQTLDDSLLQDSCYGFFASRRCIVKSEIISSASTVCRSQTLAALIDGVQLPQQCSRYLQSPCWCLDVASSFFIRPSSVLSNFFREFSYERLELFNDGC
jgi:hypothetical protein